MFRKQRFVISICLQIQIDMLKKMILVNFSEICNVKNTMATCKMHSEYRHPSIQLFMMSLKPSDCKAKGIDDHVDEVRSKETEQISVNNDVSSCHSNEAYDCRDDQIEGGSTIALDLQSKKISDWEARIRSHGC